MAREGYLLHAGKDEIHDPSVEIRADTPRKKWDNFWYYHKKHVILGVLAAAVLGYMIYDTASAVRPDYTVGLATQAAYPSEMTDALQTEMAKCGKDLNGDGRVVVSVVPYVLAGGDDLPSGSLADPQALMAYQTKFMADLSAGDSILFFTDDATFRKVQGQDGVFAYTDGSTPKEGDKDYDRMRVPLEKCPKLAGLKIRFETASGSAEAGLPKGLSLSLRVYYGSGIEGKAPEYYAASKELFQKLTAA